MKYFIVIAFILALASAAFAETEPTTTELEQEVARNGPNNESLQGMVKGADEEK